jgi:hypothetical protein
MASAAPIAPTADELAVDSAIRRRESGIAAAGAAPAVCLDDDGRASKARP